MSLKSLILRPENYNCKECYIIGKYIVKSIAGIQVIKPKSWSQLITWNFKIKKSGIQIQKVKTKELAILKKVLYVPTKALMCTKIWEFQQPGNIQELGSYLVLYYSTRFLPNYLRSDLAIFLIPYDFKLTFISNFLKFLLF